MSPKKRAASLLGLVGLLAGQESTLHLPFEEDLRQDQRRDLARLRGRRRLGRRARRCGRRGCRRGRRWLRADVRRPVPADPGAPVTVRPEVGVTARPGTVARPSRWGWPTDTVRILGLRLLRDRAVLRLLRVVAPIPLVDLPRADHPEIAGQAVVVQLALGKDGLLLEHESGKSGSIFRLTATVSP